MQEKPSPKDTLGLPNKWQPSPFSFFSLGSLSLPAKEKKPKLCFSFFFSTPSFFLTKKKVLFLCLLPSFKKPPSFLLFSSLAAGLFQSFHFDFLPDFWAASQRAQGSRKRKGGVLVGAFTCMGCHPEEMKQVEIDFNADVAQKVDLVTRSVESAGLWV